MVKAAPTNPLMVINSSAAQSSTDAAWVQSERSLPVNTLSFNFGSGSGALTLAQYTGTESFSCQTATANGTDVSSTYAGLSMQAAISSYCNTYGIDALIFSTLTPSQIYDGTYDYAVCGYAANHGPNTIPGHGRLGCPAANWSWSAELVPKSGSALIGAISSILYTATVNALAREAISNASQNHWGSSVMNYSPYISTVNNTAILTNWSSNGLSTVDLGGTTGSTDNVNETAFFSGSVSPAPSLFALLIGSGIWNTSGTPGNEGFSNNYSPAAGAWGMSWNSFDFHFGEDLLYNGGSAALFVTQEPEAEGLLDIVEIASQLLTNRASLCYLTVLINQAYPGTEIMIPGELTVWGDPLYRPYKNTYTPSWGATRGFISGTPIGQS